MYSNEEDVEVIPTPLQHIDWQRFDNQKAWLAKQAESLQRHGNKQAYGYACGILNLLDSIQEYLVEECGQNPYEVYKQTPTTEMQR